MTESQESGFRQDDADLEWQIERYVLGDEGWDADLGDEWDLEGFEARLEQDPGLAQRVALAVDDLVLLKQAAKALPLGTGYGENAGDTLALPESDTLDPIPGGLQSWRTLASLAALLLVGVGITWGITEYASEPIRAEASANEMSQVAASWVALNPVSLEVGAEEAVDDWGIEEEDLYGAEFGSDAEESDDWLYLGGQDYFLNASMSEYKAES